MKQLIYNSYRVCLTRRGPSATASVAADVIILVFNTSAEHLISSIVHGWQRGPFLRIEPIMQIQEPFSHLAKCGRSSQHIDGVYQQGWLGVYECKLKEFKEHVAADGKYCQRIFWTR